MIGMQCAFIGKLTKPPLKGSTESGKRFVKLATISVDINDEEQDALELEEGAS